MDVTEYQKRVARVIHEHGWMVQGVFPRRGDEGLPFAYTIGLTDAGRPELIISGPFPPADVQNLLNVAAQIHIEKEIRPGDLVPGIAAGDVLFKAQAARVGGHVQQALNYYRDIFGTGGKVRLIQLIWPDKHGNFPSVFNNMDHVQEQWPLTRAGD